MPKVGDRVVVQGSKVGGARREGTLRKVVGTMIQVRWIDGTETLFAPGAGTVQFLPGNGNQSAKKAAKQAAKPTVKTTAKAAKRAQGKAGKGKNKKK